MIKVLSNIDAMKYEIRHILLIMLCLIVINNPLKAQDTLKEITGKVISADTKAPIVGINVFVENYSAAMTDEFGVFKLKVPSFNAELIVSGPFYKSKRVVLKDNKDIIITLQDQSLGNSVYKEVLTAIGVVNNSHLTSSISSIACNSETESGDMPEDLLFGASGLNVITRSGMEGSGANLFLRGFNSIYAGNQPLIIIDGMVIENQQFGSSLIDGYLSTPMGAINVRDIDQISVLKDATSIYGVKGSNGAIIIQTKSTQDLTTKINVRSLVGMNLKPLKLPVLNNEQSKKYLIEMAQNAGYSAAEIEKMPFVNSEIPVLEKWGYSGNVDYYRYNQNTDWQEELFQESFKQQYSLEVSGGDETAVYGLSLGYLLKEGVVKGTDYDRFDARINTGITFSPKLKVKTNMSFVYGQKNLANEGTSSFLNPIYSSLVKPEFTTIQVMDELNNASPNYEDVDCFGLANPGVVTDKTIAQNSFYRFIGNMDVRAQLTKNLTLSTNFGIDFNKEREKIFYPKGGIPYSDIALAAVTNMQQHRVERLFTLFDETRLNYVYSITPNQKIDAMLGFRYMNSKAENDYGKGFNSSSNYYVSIGSGSNKLYQTGGALGDWNWMAYYANVSYNLFNRYFIDAVLSRDASSRYGSGVSTFKNYPSIAGAWLISSEQWFSADFVDMFKLRLSYGLSGNDAIGNHSAKRYYIAQNFLGNYGLVRGNLVNEDLKPETNEKLNIGADLSFFNERFTVSADIYKNKISDLLIYSNAPSWSGFSSYLDNGGSMKNIGADINLGIRILNTKRLKWDLSASISHYKNQIVSLKTGDFNTQISDALIRTQVGDALGVFYGYKTDGIFKTTQEAQSASLYSMIGTNKVQFKAGDVRFQEILVDGIIDENDMQVIGDPNPDFFGSFSTNIKYRRVTLSALFRYSYGNDIYNYTRRNLESMSGWENQTKSVLNRWRVEGQQTDVPKLSYGDPMGNSRFSDRWIEDGSYIKLKNINLSYDFPLKSQIFTDLMIYACAENLFTITKYKGYDPEVICSSTNPLSYGIDAFSTPNARTFYIGVKIGL